MKLEDQVCSLELAQKLKVLGVKQNSVFWWMQRKGGSIFVSSAYGCDCWVELPYDNEIFCCAFTVAELAEYFPENIASGKDFSGSYFCRVFNKDDMIFFDGTEADARAKALIYLIENKLVKVSDGNDNKNNT